MAYSLDLRKKVVKAYKEEKISQLQLAKIFKINISTVKRYLQLDREGKDLSAQIAGKGRPSQIDDLGYERIRQIIAQDPTTTLEGLAKIFSRERKIKVSRTVLSRACLKLKLRRKKLSRYAVEKEQDEIKKNVKIICKR